VREPFAYLKPIRHARITYQESRFTVSDMTPRFHKLRIANIRPETADAVCVAEALKPYNLLFIEDPVAPENLDGYRRIRDTVGGLRSETLVEVLVPGDRHVDP